MDVTANTMLFLMYEKCIEYNTRRILRVFKINISHLAIGEAISYVRLCIGLQKIQTAQRKTLLLLAF